MSFEPHYINLYIIYGIFIWIFILILISILNYICDVCDFLHPFDYSDYSESYTFIRKHPSNKKKDE